MGHVYSEPLKSGGILWVYKRMWSIRFYLPSRTKHSGYRGKFFTISGKDVESYKEAFKEYYKGYLDLLDAFPNDAVLTRGKLGISYGTGTIDGVFIENPKDLSCFVRVTSRKGLNQLISDFEYAEKRARKIQGTFKKELENSELSS